MKDMVPERSKKAVRTGEPHSIRIGVDCGTPCAVSRNYFIPKGRNVEGQDCVAGGGKLKRSAGPEYLRNDRKKTSQGFPWEEKTACSDRKVVEGSRPVVEEERSSAR